MGGDGLRVSRAQFSITSSMGAAGVLSLVQSQQSRQTLSPAVGAGIMTRGSNWSATERPATEGDPSKTSIGNAQHFAGRSFHFVMLRPRSRAHEEPQPRPIYARTAVRGDDHWSMRAIVPLVA